MGERHIYSVTHREHDFAMIVVAASPDEAVRLTIAYDGDEPTNAGDYTATRDHDPCRIRWVSFGSEELRQGMISRLLDSGATFSHMFAKTRRVESCDGPLWEWRIGASDDSWARLPPCVISEVCHG